MKKIEEILERLEKEIPEAQTALNYRRPLELLVSTILSAQCTDQRVNMVTKTLFKKYKNAHDYASSKLEELEENIRHTGFHKNKTKAIKSWPEDERPREKLLKHGEHTLSNTELLAILLRTGVKGESAIDLARKVLQTRD